MAKALNELTAAHNPGNPRQSEISRLVQQIDELLGVTEMADDGSVAVREDGSAEARIATFTLASLKEEAEERASALASAISALEPESIDDALVLLVLATAELETWKTNFGPCPTPQPTQEAKNVEAARIAAANRQYDAIERMLLAAARGIKAAGGKVPPTFDEFYSWPKNKPWREKVSEALGKVMKD